MGCNSHLALEVREKGYNDSIEWHSYAIDVPESRDYIMYTLMAGVRGDEDLAIVTPRGIPKDADSWTENWFKRWEGDGHTPSYLSADEYRQVLKKYADFEGGKYNEVPHSNWTALGNVLDALEKTYGKDNARVVFFFDN